MEPPPALTNYRSKKVALTTKNEKSMGKMGWEGGGTQSSKVGGEGKKKSTMGLGRGMPLLYFWKAILWRVDPHAPQKCNFLWRIWQHAPQKWLPQSLVPSPLIFLWRMGPDAP